ncbi:phosphotransferase family protein [Kribbella italica]|uniref:Aminoglycoside phosphotransferase (APT) family kinase protein n=1 Tax=Kribbella italica TaxID=1540520 RepID=A0A7W9MYT1_9ACTN|nr:aminoglycoside phosphotransferase family protein [Kribbella italica]MBB5840707.1 aminoglycoside phosphotransferase (APT) family kinase protein [Kribbella italica]
MTVRPKTLAWVAAQLADGERIVGVDILVGGITAEMRRLTIAGPDGTRALVLRSYVDVPHAKDALTREAAALTMLAATTVTAPELVGVDALADECEYPSLLMTALPGRAVLDDAGLEARIPLLARELVKIHALQPVERPPTYQTFTTAGSVIVPPGADAQTWSAAIDVLRGPVPSYDGRYLHRDFQPGNVLFDGQDLTGVVDWAGPSWGPADLDVAHCAANLALIHGPARGLEFVAAYEAAGGLLAKAPADRRYWLIRDALSFSEELDAVTGAWRAAGRPDLTVRTAEQRLDTYLQELGGRHH